MTNHLPRAQPDEGEIQAVHSAWIAAASAGNLDRLLSLMTADAVFLNPGAEPIGREAFSVRFSTAHQQFRIRCTSELEEIVVAGKVAYTRARDALSVTPRDGAAATQLTGHRLTIYRQQPDGRWLLARDANTLTKSS